MPTWWAVQLIKSIFFMILCDSINDMKHFQMSALHLSRATAMFVVDRYHFGPSWRFGLEMELMACAGLVRNTTEKIFLFPDLI